MSTGSFAGAEEPPTYPVVAPHADWSMQEREDWCGNLSRADPSLSFFQHPQTEFTDRPEETRSNEWVASEHFINACRDDPQAEYEDFLIRERERQQQPNH